MCVQWNVKTDRKQSAIGFKTWVKKIKTKQYQSIGLETRLNNMQLKQRKLIQFYFLKFTNESAMKETETKS